MLIKSILILYCQTFGIKKAVAEVKSIYLLESPLNGSLTYNSLCKRFAVNPFTETRITDLYSDPAQNKGILIYRSELKNGILYEKRFAGIEVKYFNSNERRALGSPTKVNLTDKNEVEYCAPIYQLRVKSRNELEIQVRRLDLRYTMQTNILIFKLFEFLSGRNLERTRNVFEKLIIDFSERGPVYQKLVSGDYFLLYFRNNIHGLVSFFQEVNNIIHGSSINDNLIELVYRVIHLSNNSSFESFYEEEEIQTANFKIEYLKKILIIDIINVLSLGISHNYIFNFPKVDHINEFTTGVPALSIKIDNMIVEDTLKVKNDKNYPVKYFMSNNDNNLFIVITLYDLISTDSCFINISFNGNDGVYECDSIIMKPIFEEFDK